MNGPEQAKQKDVIEKQLDLDWSRRLCLNVTLTWTSEREMQQWWHFYEEDEDQSNQNP